MSCLLSSLSVIRIDQKFFVGIFVPFGVNWLLPVSREDLAAGGDSCMASGWIFASFLEPGEQFWE